jgi:sucrose-phosphate synthase
MSGYYVQLFSPHGLIRFHDPEIGRDRDTGGQVKYLVELLEALSLHPMIRKVDLFTRRISDKRVSGAYEKEVENVNEKARIIRVTCGGNAYRAKETLWDHLDEFVDKTIRLIEKEDDFPDIVHGHYADGNYIAGQISEIYGIPFLATGHSLGRNKKSILLKDGLSEETIEAKFSMSQRIRAEEKTLLTANAVIVSTNHEISSQYALYDNKEAAKFEVLPPGVNNELFYPFYRYGLPNTKMPVEQEQALYRVHSDIERFLFNPSKPLILSIGRADKRKNFETIIQCYGQDKELQAMANLAIFAGVRKDISRMPAEEQDILTNLLLLLDKYDLYGKMAIPKKNDPRLDVPEIYRLAAHKKGVFINATPGENFGLTLIEAAACGLPAVASPTGGPREILENCKNGLLVDVDDRAAIAQALKTIIADQKLWDEYSSNGILASNNLYSWKAHAEKYVSLIGELIGSGPKPSVHAGRSAFGKKLAKAEQFIITDLDGTLIEGNESVGLKELTEWIEERKRGVVFGIATGRNREITRLAFEKFHLPEPDILICSAGSEIYYTDKFIVDKGYESYINYQWKRKELEALLSRFPKIRLQEPEAQWRFKISYYTDPDFDDDDMADLHKFLDDHKLRAKILLTENKFLDLLPFRAGKGNAVRYLSKKWKVPLTQIITAGNSGNDIDMVAGKTKGIVVANYSPEMEELRDNKFVYFTKYPLAQGVLEGINFHLS